MKELCEVCERVAWGDIVRLGFGKWRHDACYPGSAEWLERFRCLPEEKKTEEGRILYASKVASQCESIGLVQTLTEELQS